MNGKLAVVCVCAAAMMGGLIRRPLVTTTSEVEAREIAVALYQGNVRSFIAQDAKRDSSGLAKWRISIHGGDRTLVEAWRVLRENGLPRGQEMGVEQVYRQQQIIPTASEERVRYLMAISGEFSKTLRGLPGVTDARVHVAVPDANNLRDPSQTVRSSASVMLRYSEAEPPVEEVRGLIAKGVEGLDAANITVVSKRQPPVERRGPAEAGMALFPTPALVLDALEWLLIVFAVMAVAEWLRRLEFVKEALARLPLAGRSAGTPA